LRFPNDEVLGANLLLVSRRLGHSTVQITADVYGHLFPETNDLVINRLDKALRAAFPHPTDTTASIDNPDANPTGPTAPSRHATGTTHQAQPERPGRTRQRP
jgi:hypothetical protein